MEMDVGGASGVGIHRDLLVLVGAVAVDAVERAGDVDEAGPVALPGAGDRGVEVVDHHLEVDDVLGGQAGDGGRADVVDAVCPVSHGRRESGHEAGGLVRPGRVGVGEHHPAESGSAPVLGEIGGERCYAVPPQLGQFGGFTHPDVHLRIRFFGAHGDDEVA